MYANMEGFYWDDHNHGQPKKQTIVIKAASILMNYSKSKTIKNMLCRAVIGTTHSQWAARWGALPDNIFNYFTSKCS